MVRYNLRRMQLNWFEKLTDRLDYEIDTPTIFGAFHILFIVLVVALTVYLCKKYRNCSDKTFRTILFASWCAMVLLEMYKQINFSFSIQGEDAVWDYSWYAFPFQFCSTPIYVMPFVIFGKNSKVRDAVLAFLATFSLFAGLTVYIYPEQVFISTLGIDIQTMVHHGLQVVLGIYITVRNKHRLNWQFFSKGIFVLGALILSAIVLNETVHYAFVQFGIDETFNMFFLSRHYECTLPLLGSIASKVPNIVVILIYFSVMTLAGFVIMQIQRGIIYLVENKINKGKQSDKSPEYVNQS